MKRSDVRSALARSENKGAGTGQCQSRYRLPDDALWGALRGSVIQCKRPDTAHRVHQHAHVQWEKGNSQ